MGINLTENNIVQFIDITHFPQKPQKYHQLS